jgi:hypothetical protein
MATVIGSVDLSRTFAGGLMWSQKHDDCGLKHLVLWVATATIAT